MTKERSEVVLPWGQHGVIRRKKSVKWLDCPKSSDAGCRMVHDTPYDVLCKLVYKWHQVLFSVGGMCVCVSV